MNSVPLSFPPPPQAILQGESPLPDAFAEAAEQPDTVPTPPNDTGSVRLEGMRYRVDFTVLLGRTTQGPHSLRMANRQYACSLRIIDGQPILSVGCQKHPLSYWFSSKGEALFARHCLADEVPVPISSGTRCSCGQPNCPLGVPETQEEFEKRRDLAIKFNAERKALLESFRAALTQVANIAESLRVAETEEV